MLENDFRLTRNNLHLFTFISNLDALELNHFVNNLNLNCRYVWLNLSCTQKRSKTDTDRRIELSWMFFPGARLRWDPLIDFGLGSLKLIAGTWKIWTFLPEIRFPAVELKWLNNLFHCFLAKQFVYYKYWFLNANYYDVIEQFV